MMYNKLIPLIKKVGSSLSPKDFQSVVNVVFHDYEAEHYDLLHSDMKESLQEQVDLLISDLFNHSNSDFKSLKLLDVGCGTGMSTQFMIDSKLGSSISDVTLIDTSKRMLQIAELKAKNWQKEYSLINSEVFDIDDQFDIVLICSVLHHIPNLSEFLEQIDSLLKSGGILIHLQDPNADFSKDVNYLKRIETYNNTLNNKNQTRNIWSADIKKLKNRINRILGRKTYIDLINDKLLKDKIIKKRMTANEIWSVTDIHIKSSINPNVNGISFEFLKQQLDNYYLINRRTYGFFGPLESKLFGEFKQLEKALILDNKLDGRNLSCIWLKN